MRDRSLSSTLLIVLIVVITCPLWLGLGGIVLGILGGLFGAMIGVFGAVFGALMAVITLPFRLLFGHGWDHDGIFHMGDGTLTLIAVILVVALLVRRKRTTS